MRRPLSPEELRALFEKAQEHRRLRQLRRKRAKVAGMCIRCHKLPPRPNARQCAPCHSILQSAADRRRRAARRKAAAEEAKAARAALRRKKRAAREGANRAYLDFSLPAE